MFRSLSLAALLLLPQDPPETKPAEPPPSHEVKKGNLVPTLEIDGAFEAAEPAEIRLRLEAYHGELTVLRAAAHGQSVRKDEPVLELDPTPIDRQIASLENDFRVTRAALDKAQADMELGLRAEALALEQSTTSLKNAQTELRIFDEVDGKQMLQQADLSIRYGEDNVADQQEELDQLEKMYKSEELTNATAEIVVRRARRSLERSKVYLAMTKEDAQVTKQVRHPQRRHAYQHAVNLAQQSLESLRVSQALSRVQREAELVRAQNNYREKEEQLAKLRRDREIFTVRAPFDGRAFFGQFQNGMWTTVDQVAPLLRPRERVNAGMILMTVCSPALRVRADLPEGSYFDVFEGQEGTAAPVSMSDTKLAGRVRSKGVTGQARGPSPTFEVKIDLDEQKAELLPGMKAKVTLKGKELVDVLLVPSNAISSAGGKQTVSVLKNGKPSPREVTVGRSDGKMTHVKTGLEAGDKVAVPK